MPKLSGLALFAAMVLLRLSVLHWNLDGEFFRLHLVSEKISVIGAQKGRNEGKGVLVQPSAILCRLSTLQVVSCRCGCSCSSVRFPRCEVRCSSHGSGRGSRVLLPLREDHCLRLGVRCSHLISGVLRHVCGFALLSRLQEDFSSSHGSCLCSRVWLPRFVVTTACIFTSGAHIIMSGPFDSHFVWDPGFHRLCFCWILLGHRTCSMVSSSGPGASGFVLGLRFGSCDIALVSQLANAQASDEAIGANVVYGYYDASKGVFLCGYRSRVTTGGRGEDPARSSSSSCVTFGLSFGVFLVLAKSSRGWRNKESMVEGSWRN